jgi:peptidoglycan/xylan/chitin deacetylase (PgdA/CDA1 family)
MTKHQLGIFAFIIMLGLSFLLELPVIIIFLIVLVWANITAVGSYFIQLNYFLTSKNKLSSTSNILLTFDDGPHPIYTPLVLNILKKHNIKAVFFLIGKNINGNEDIVKQIKEEGHFIGNHSFSHENTFPIWSTEKIKEDIMKCDEKILSLNIETNLFRPPFGVTNPNIAKAIHQLNFQSIGWSLRTYDTSSTSKEQLIEKVKTKIKGGDIILMHENAPYTVESLEEIINVIDEKNLMFATVIE